MTTRLAILAGAALALLGAPCGARATTTAPALPVVGVGSQYDGSHVYVPAAELSAFSASFVATFGGTASAPSVFTITPTPSSTAFQALATPVGTISAFGFSTPIPYPFGAERTGYLVTDLDAAVRAARASGASLVVAPFKDPIGRDAIIEWPGGVLMQLYWHTVAPHSAPLATVPENRVYVSPDSVAAFVRDFLRFSHGKVVSDVAQAPGVEIGVPGSTFRRIRIESIFGKLTALITDGHLPFPYGRETTGYEVSDLDATLAKAKAAGATVLVAPYTSTVRTAALVQFPGGYIAEIHAVVK